jgi:hypothetical protein
MPGGVDLTPDIRFRHFRRRPPTAVPPEEPKKEERDLRPTTTIVGKQGDATVVQHEDGSQSVVGEKGLKDLGIKKP